MKLSFLTAALLPIVIGAAALVSHAPTAKAAQDLGPPVKKVECGDFGADSFRTAVPPAKGAAIGHSQAASERACAIALAKLNFALATIADGMGVPVPACPGPKSCPPDTYGCLPALEIENAAFFLKVEIEQMSFPDGTEITVCTASVAGQVTVMTGCSACW